MPQYQKAIGKLAPSPNPSKLVEEAVDSQQVLPAWSDCKNVKELEELAEVKRKNLRHLLAQYNQLIEDNSRMMLEYHDLLIHELAPKYCSRESNGI